MRIRALVLALGAVATAALAAYGVSCVNNDTVDTTCPTYCQAVAATCEGGAAQYKSNDICLSMCGAMDPGEAGVAAGDTRACRNVYLSTATDDPAGPYGDCLNAGASSSLCPGPDRCIAFCDIDMKLCAGNNGYTGAADCLSTCHTWDDVVADASFSPPLIGSTGNTLECRTYHLELSQDPTIPGAINVHCPHTGRVSVVCFDKDGGASDAPPG